MTRVSAAEVYLIEEWHKHTGKPTERRNKIFKAFIALGMRGRWTWHRKAADFDFSKDEEEILKCRSGEERAIADWVGEELRRVLFTKKHFTDEQLEFITGWSRENEKLVLEDVEALPERVYSLTMYDDPDDVEAGETLVSGVYWVADEELKIVWVDEYGETIREKVCDPEDLEEGAEAFERYRPFESIWWTEAVRVGKYAE